MYCALTPTPTHIQSLKETCIDLFVVRLWVFRDPQPPPFPISAFPPGSNHLRSGSRGTRPPQGGATPRGHWPRPCLKGRRQARTVTMMNMNRQRQGSMHLLTFTSTTSFTFSQRLLSIHLQLPSQSQPVIPYLVGGRFALPTFVFRLPEYNTHKHT